jgi:hypothetical protein
VRDAFRAAGADPEIGSKLPRILPAAGLEAVAGLAIQRYCPPGDADAAAQLVGVVRSLGGPPEAAGIPDAARDSVVVLPALVGAWGVVAG